jgi:hypothetical protein
MKRLFLGVVLALALSGCGTGTTVTPGSPSHEALPRICHSAQLTVRRGFMGVATGSVGAHVVFTNVSESRCSLEGYPKLQMLDAAGRHIPTVLHKGSFMTVPQMRVRPVSLAPGASASFYIGFEDATGYGDAQCPTSTRIQVTPPENTKPMTIAWRLQPYGGSTIAKLRCGEITVSPVVPGNRKRA